MPSIIAERHRYNKDLRVLLILCFIIGAQCHCRKDVPWASGSAAEHRAGTMPTTITGFIVAMARTGCYNHP
jgi:hypothetical protein